MSLINKLMKEEWKEKTEKKEKKKKSISIIYSFCLKINCWKISIYTCVFRDHVKLPEIFRISSCTLFYIPYK